MSALLASTPLYLACCIWRRATTTAPNIACSLKVSTWAVISQKANMHLPLDFACTLRTLLAGCLCISIELMCTPDETLKMRKHGMQAVNVPEDRLADFLAVNRPAMKLPNFCIPSRCFSVDACSSVQ